MYSTTPPIREVTKMSANEELLALRSEVARLRDLVGPTEESYEKLRLDVLGARDVAKAAEAALGSARARTVELQAQCDRYEREFLWFRNTVTAQLLGLRKFVPTVRRVTRFFASR